MPRRTKPLTGVPKTGTGIWEVSNQCQAHEWGEAEQGESFLYSNSKLDDEGSWRFLELFKRPCSMPFPFHCALTPVILITLGSSVVEQSESQKDCLIAHTKPLFFITKRLQGGRNPSILHSVCKYVISFMGAAHYFVSVAWATCELEVCELEVCELEGKHSDCSLSRERQVTTTVGYRYWDTPSHMVPESASFLMIGVIKDSGRQKTVKWIHHLLNLFYDVLGRDAFDLENSLKYISPFEIVFPSPWEV